MTDPMRDPRITTAAIGLATQGVLVALARELLFSQGTEAFIRAEQSAKNFIEALGQGDVRVPSEVCAVALASVAEIFGAADS